MHLQVKNTLKTTSTTFLNTPYMYLWNDPNLFFSDR